jgi:hypothetical protein
MLYWLWRWPGNSVYANVSFVQTGGQASTAPPDTTAFAHRNNDWYMIWYLKWSSKDSAGTVNTHLAWLNDFYETIRPYVITDGVSELSGSLADGLSAAILCEQSAPA